MKTKLCKKCNEEKDVSYFAKSSNRKDGLQTKCKICDKAYRELNKEKISKYLKNYNLDNREILLEKKRKYRLDNIEAIRKRDREWAKNNQDKVKANQEKQWSINRKKYYEKSVLRDAYRRKTDVLYKIKSLLSHRTRLAMKGIGLKKSILTKNIIGCTFKELKFYLESKFQPGMSWENRSEWHIDHIIPLATAKTEEDVIRLNHYTNLQPLWAADNLRKSDKLDFQL